MRHLTVGTAGHIDHGKSALVHALTGTDPDRLKEEKARGITIDLGFADLDLGSGRVLSFVDVPGHERFVRHMVAGATGIDCVLLVVAADDGIRPQTREHLAICSLLGVRHGVVVLTKSDLVGAELLGVVELEVREFLGGSFLEAAPLHAVSSRTGAGLDLLRRTLSSLFDSVPERPAGGMTRLPVDRAFILHGFGTVVTGTLASGELCEGEEIEVLPGGRRGRVRGLQVHRHRVPSARAGQRTAVNLQGLDREEVPRGSTLGLPGTLPTTRRIWTRLHLLPSAPERLRKGGPVRFHQGTCERSARLSVMGEGAGGDLEAELVLGAETVLLPGDPFILRRPAPVDTVGGGLVVDVRPPARRIRSAGGAVLGSEDPDQGLLLRLERAGATGREPDGLASELGLAASDFRSRASRLEEAGLLIRAGGYLVDAAAWFQLQRGCIEALSQFHSREPLRFGMSREELRSRICRDMPQEVWRGFLERLEAGGLVRLDGERVAEAGHTVTLSSEDRDLAQRLERRFQDARLDPPDPSVVISAEGGQRAARILDLLVGEGRLVRIRDGRLFHAEALEALRKKLREYARTSQVIDVGTFKQIAGVTRKNAIPLLEQLDAERTTRRVGNLREILDGASFRG